MHNDVLKAFTEASRTRALTENELNVLQRIYQESRATRLSLDRDSKQFKELEDTADALLIDELRKKGAPKSFVLSGLRCELLPVKYKPHVQSWEKFTQFIFEEKDLSLLERRPSSSAVSERWNDDKVVPGVEKFPVYALSRTAV